MKTKTLVLAAMSLCMASNSIPTYAQSVPPHSAAGQFGTVGGVARDSGGQPLGEARIILRNVDKGTERTAAGGADGAFEVTNLEPGRYEVTATLAARNGDGKH